MSDPNAAPLNPAAVYGKLIAGTSASVLGGALTTLICGIIAGIDPSYQMTNAMQGAIQTLDTGLITGLAIYLAPHSFS
jgi:hypothetical protein